jgi:hypothetical protein
MIFKYKRRKFLKFLYLEMNFKIYLYLLVSFISYVYSFSQCYDNSNKPRKCSPGFENVAYDLKVASTNTCGSYI